MLAGENTPFRIQAYRIKELRLWYRVSYKTWRAWTKGVPELGDYNGKAYTPAQVEKIVKHIGYP